MHVPDKGSYLPTLDGWRTIAILMVIFCHGSSSINIPQIRDYLGTPGVDLFFGLSGFLITTLLLKEETKSGSISLRGFYTRRIFRIIPAALLFLTTIFILKLAGLVDVGATRWLSALFFMANYSSAPQSWYVAHFWSLAVEEHFYLIWPATMLLVRNNRKRLWIVLLSAFAVDLWRVVDYKYHLTLSGPTYLWAHRTDITADGILFGVVFALALADEHLGAKLTKFVQIWWVGPVAIAVFILTCILPQQVGWKAEYLLLSLRSAVVPVMILAALHRPTGAVGRVLEWKALRLVGLISYSLYLWQELFLTWQPSRLTVVQWFPLNVALTFGVATLSFYVVEKPMIALGHSLARTTFRSPDRLSHPSSTAQASSPSHS